MSWTLVWRWSAAILVAAGVADSAAWATERIGAEDRKVVVRVYNYAGISTPLLEASQETASELLGRAGVQLEFVGCRLRPEDPPAGKACQEPATPLDLYVSILDPNMARNAGASRDCLGFALVTADLPSRAAVFSHRALELAESSRASLAGTFGAMMAHEIGHLLLEQPVHSPRGIMQARWSDEDLRTIARGRMLFTADQASQLRSMVAKRQQASTRQRGDAIVDVARLPMSELPPWAP